jgi:hypothetical protein
MSNDEKRQQAWDNVRAAETQKLREEMDIRFRYHPPIPGQPERYEKLRAKAREFAEMILDFTPYSREQSLALTSLEESIFWANASIARRESPPKTQQSLGLK